MHHRFQFDMRENPASNRRHDSRSSAAALSKRNYGEEEPVNLPPRGLAENPDHANFDSGSNAASPRATTGAEITAEGHLLTVHDVAELLQVSASWIYSRTRRRSLQRLPGYRLGKYWRFRQSEVLAWIERQRGEFHVS
jgi:excisionase family DNA binding protein